MTMTMTMIGGPVIGSKAEIATTAASKGENDLEGSLQLIIIMPAIVKLIIMITTIVKTMVTKVIMIMIMESR